MAYLSTAALYRPRYTTDTVTGAKVALPPSSKGTVVFDSADSVYTASGAATIVQSSVGLDAANGYPGFTRPTGDFTTAFALGDVVYVTGAAAANNGSDAAPKVFRVAYLTATKLGVEGPNAAGITGAAANAAFKIRKVRPFSLATLRSIAGGAIPVTLQATLSANLAMTLLTSLDDGVTWDALPNVILPDTNNGNAKVIQFFVGYDALLLVYPGASYTSGKIYAA